MKPFNLLNEFGFAAIVTKYRPATDTQGSRILATANGFKVYVGVNTTLRDDQNHIQAAKKLARKLDWTDEQTKWAMGYTKQGMVFVPVHKH